MSQQGRVAFGYLPELYITQRSWPNSSLLYCCLSCITQRKLAEFITVVLLRSVVAEFITYQIYYCCAVVLRLCITTRKPTSSRHSIQSPRDANPIPVPGIRIKPFHMIHLVPAAKMEDSYNEQLENITNH